MISSEAVAPYFSAIGLLALVAAMQFARKVLPPNINVNARNRPSTEEQDHMVAQRRTHLTILKHVAGVLLMGATAATVLVTFISPCPPTAVLLFYAASFGALLTRLSLGADAAHVHIRLVY